MTKRFLTATLLFTGIWCMTASSARAQQSTAAQPDPVTRDAERQILLAEAASREAADLPDFQQDPVYAAAAAAGDATTVTVSDAVVVPKAKRLGINLGHHDRWGAGQIVKNLISNPGFEAGIYNTILHITNGATATRVQQDFWDANWNRDEQSIGQQPGFWQGGSYEWIYGDAKGSTGLISAFTHEPDPAGNNRYTFYMNPPTPTAPKRWDAMIARKTLPGINGDMSRVDTSTKRPGSPGTQSMRLTYPGAGWMSAWDFYMDSYHRDGDTTADKLFVIKGNWRAEFWAKGKRNGDSIRVRFYRNDGTPSFIDKTFELTTAWQKFTADDFVPEGRDVYPTPAGASRAILVLSFYLPVSGSEVWIDDLSLHCTDDKNPTVFRDEAVKRLKELNPGVLRYWGAQLGDTLDNQLATPFARKTHGYRPHERKAVNIDFSLHEFLELCREINAEPWYVMPPTFSQDELRNLVAYLSAPAGQGNPYAEKRAALGQVEPWSTVFSEIHVEYGNEMWGSASGSDPFWGASALGGPRLGAIAHDRFTIMRSSPFFNDEKLNLIIGGQAGYPATQFDIESGSTAHNEIAIAPYFGHLNTFNTVEEIFYPLFARAQWDIDGGMVQQSDYHIKRTGRSTRMAVYEINFHTTGGPAPNDIRNDFLTSQAGGVALPLYMLKYQKEFGMKNLCSFLFCGYSFKTKDAGYARIWGMMRDLFATGRKRPTWLGVELANMAVRGDMITTTHSGANPGWSQSGINDVGPGTYTDYIQSFAFKDGREYSLILFNLNIHNSLPVNVSMPAGARQTRVEQYQLYSNSIHDDNETSEMVQIRALKPDLPGGSFDTTLPPHSVTVFLFNDVSNKLDPMWYGPEVPAAGTAGLLVLTGCLALAGIVRRRAQRN